MPVNHPYAKLQAAPNIRTAPQLLLLGSSEGSASIAAEQGLPFTYAHFFGVPGGEYAMQLYKEQCVPSSFYPEPLAMLAVIAICAPSEQEAKELEASTDLFFLILEKGEELREFPSVQTALNYPYTEADR